MATKVRRKRIVKPIRPDEPDEIISVPVDPNAGNSCDGCYYYDENKEVCNDKENRICVGEIFIKKAK